jgi:CarD family transcriptional regulator
LLFKTDDFVVHPIYGVGQIVKIEEKEFAEQGKHLYYKITLPKRMIWIPVEAQNGGGLRLVTARTELDQYRTLLKSSPNPLDKNHHKRQQELEKRLEEGSFQALCEVVRDLTASDSQKRLAQKDASLLRKSRESLHQEWATAAGISLAEAIKEVDALLRVTLQHLEAV